MLDENSSALALWWENEDEGKDKDEDKDMTLR